MILQIWSLVIVALLWGCTNPILKRNSTKIVNIKSTSKIEKFYLEVKYLFTNLSYMIPFVVNQLGSVLYFIVLQNTDISLALPVANSLTFVSTAIVGWILGEELPRQNIRCTEGPDRKKYVVDDDRRKFVWCVSGRAFLYTCYEDNADCYFDVEGQQCVCMTKAVKNNFIRKDKYINYPGGVKSNSSVCGVSPLLRI